MRGVGDYGEVASPEVCNADEGKDLPPAGDDGSLGYLVRLEQHADEKISCERGTARSTKCLQAQSCP